jgi:hypothetical protein
MKKSLLGKIGTSSDVIVGETVEGDNKKPAAGKSLISLFGNAGSEVQQNNGAAGPSEPLQSDGRLGLMGMLAA